MTQQCGTDKNSLLLPPIVSPATPSLPAPGNFKVFSDANGTLYVLDSNGVATAVSPIGVDAPNDGELYGRQSNAWKSVGFYYDFIVGDTPDADYATINDMYLAEVGAWTDETMNVLVKGFATTDFPANLILLVNLRIVVDVDARLSINTDTNISSTLIQELSIEGISSERSLLSIDTNRSITVSMAEFIVKHISCFSNAGGPATLSLIVAAGKKLYLSNLLAAVFQVPYSIAMTIAISGNAPGKGQTNPTLTVRDVSQVQVTVAVANFDINMTLISNSLLYLTYPTPTLALFATTPVIGNRVYLTNVTIDASNTTNLKL